MSISLLPVRILAPAKINLYLSVNFKRSDGYHDLCSVMCAVSLYDALTFTFQKEAGVSVTCEHPHIRQDKYNIVDRAVRLFFEEIKRNGFSNDLGINVTIDKKIPVGSGFGGGSSDAASALLLLNNKFGNFFSKRALMSMGSKIGADVPFFIFGKPAVAKGIGNRLSIFPYRIPKFALLVYTGLSVSTSWVYENICLSQNLRLTKGKKNLSKAHLADSIFDYKHHLLNDMEIVTEIEFPIIAEAKALMLEFGALGALMSGSGSGVFGLFEDIKGVIFAWKSLLKLSRVRFWHVYAVSLLSDWRGRY